MALGWAPGGRRRVGTWWCRGGEREGRWRAAGMEWNATHMLRRTSEVRGRKRFRVQESFEIIAVVDFLRRSRYPSLRREASRHHLESDQRHVDSGYTPYTSAPPSESSPTPPRLTTSNMSHEGHGLDHSRDPCPWVALSDFGGAFCMGVSTCSVKVGRSAVLMQHVRQ